MSDRKRNILESAERIGYFGAANPQLAGELPLTVEWFAANADNVERLHQAGIHVGLVGQREVKRHAQQGGAGEGNRE